MASTHLAIYPGSFDPITYGHLDVVARARGLFDELIVAVGRNPADERVEMATKLVDELVRAHPQGAPVRVKSFAGLTVDFAKANNASALLRGVRNLSDLQYEVQQAVTNREVAGIETAFIVAGQSFAYTSSSLIRQIAAMSTDLSKLETMVPPLVIEMLKAKKAQKHPALMRLLQPADEG
jgi:pantetheine-phosphate adenylyltransferase